MAVVRIDPSSEQYRQFAELYTAARRARPSQIDRWNGDLYATVGEGRQWGSFRQDGSFALSQELVFDRLRPGAEPQQAVQAITTVLHETNHARTEIDAPSEPNAVVSRHSKALDEGLTEWVAVDDAQGFAERAGYGHLPEPEPEYPAAHQATEELLEYAAGPDNVADLASRAMDAPVVMRWDVIADEIVKNRLADVVPADPQHQQAARAELIHAMTHPEWEYLDKAPAEAGDNAAQRTTQALDKATQGIRDHYAHNPESPVPAQNPNFRVPQRAGQALSEVQERIVQHETQVDLAQLPAPSADARIEGPPAGRAAGEYSGRGSAGDGARFLSGSPSAAEATQFKPKLGNGARGAGTPAGGRGGVERPMHPTDRGRG
ncbi:hypothetical protein E1263_29735 [Kribbella antibiotica]|uniref:Uncharacterized protein n=1 Tax=Kribbella antibiotica TaxID=190195 RepID=A0A4R4Z1S1_9ACTN|nr:hypothetical protein [Kribbella antibiotica]TDD51878.1 hypothetical protein E1263_29735 [Kribbella antibiotica]